MSHSTDAKPLDRDFKNDAEWLRTIAECASMLPDDPFGVGTCEISAATQWLWPETRDNLLDIADALDSLTARSSEITDEAVRHAAALHVVSLMGDESVRDQRITTVRDTFIAGAKWALQAAEATRGEA